jgi:endogenous inhibitor of DNA gyrase (YacG/DUF329 family)
MRPGIVAIGIFILVCWLLTLSSAAFQNNLLVPILLFGGMAITLAGLAMKPSKPKETRICPRCGRQIALEYNVCPYCGKNIPVAPISVKTE